ncbi:MAG: hypothetical protein GVY32_02495, partial [Gammaproteobacteria bacterium]|nr:hypothetical protein [Gammaproteobacteria bacterium]
GSSAGKGRLAVLAEGREGLAWELTLPPSPPTGFLSSGQADVALGLTIPGYDWMQRLAASLGEDAETQMAGVSDRLEAEIGLDLAAVVDTFAGRMLYVDDDNGGYLVHEAADPERWPAFWDALSQRFDVRQAVLTAGDAEIHHLVIPGVDIDGQMDELQSENPALAFTLARFMRIGTHLFWMREDDRILIASVPQVLLARLEHPGTSALGDWLEEAGVDTASAGLFGALRVDHAPRRNYYAYIGALLAIADMLETDIDVQAFPTARELDLPEAGTVGLAIDTVDGRLGATLAFENHPGDLFYAGGGSLAGIAVVGLLAAVAVPAYQDYAVRAKLTAAYGSTSEFRSLLTRHVAEQGRLPEATLAGDWAASIPLGPDVVNSYWQSEPPGLRLVLAGGGGVQDSAKLMISPRIEAGVITGWICSSDSIADRHLPTGCR